MAIRTSTATSVGVVGGIFYLALFAAVAFGWVMNIVKLWPLLAEPFTGWVLARGVGVIVPPLGVVLGYL